MPEIIAVPPSNLLVNPENPRLIQPNEGQRDAMRALVKKLPRKILMLAKDIIANGLNPADLPIVVSAGPGESRFYVLEGNRRLVALKALENPDTFVGVLDAGSLSQMRELSKKYHDNPIDLVQCVVVANKSDADHWIKLRHTGENLGAGIVPWDSQDSGRFSARLGKKDLGIQALDYLAMHGMNADDRNKVPATSFRRLLSSPAVREKLGLGLEDGVLKVLADDKRVTKALEYVAKDLANGNTKVKDIYSAAHRKKYAQRIPKTIAVVPKLKNGRSIVMPPPVQSKAKKRGKSGSLRDRLIPRDCVLTISKARIRAIEDELRNLSLDNHSNAVSVLLRVFIELSADVYIDSHSVAATQHDKLHKKIDAVLVHLLNHSKLTAMQARPVRKAMEKKSYLSPSIDLMHDYIHNPHQFPAPADLRAHWDSLQPFIVAMWSP